MIKLSHIDHAGNIKLDRELLSIADLREAFDVDVTIRDSALSFMNGYALRSTKQEIESLTLGVASGKAEKDAVTLSLSRICALDSFSFYRKNTHKARKL